MSTMTLRITSSAVNAAGTGLGQGPDLGAPSFYDAIITDSTNPNLPNGTYDAYCLHPLLVINFSPTLYDATGSDGENIADYIAADVAAITDTQIDQINWLLAQNFTADPIFAGQYNYGEVQAAIYEILGYTPAEYNIGITPDILSDNGRQTLERTDIDFLVAQAQAAIASGNNVVPTDAYFSALIDPEGNVQPLIVQLQSAKLGNFVWQDDNNNGIQDAGELGVNNVVVELYDDAGTLIASTTTGDDFSTAAVETGFYQFTGLSAGDYQVKFVPPANMALTVKDANSNGQDTLDSDADTTTGLSDIISLSAGESNQTIDAGLVQPTPEPASISGFVYCDENDDGVKDAGEAGLGGVTVQLLNAAGAVVSTTTTDTDGSYSFTGLDAGTYSVVEPNQPAGKDDGQETAGSTGGNTDVNDTISQITVNAGEDSVNNNFGEVTPPPEPASISGFVYCDENDDGVKDAGEAGLGGVTVQLLNAAGAVVSTTTTDTDGSYSFTGLDAGTYSVVEPNQPAGKDDGQETAGSTGGDTSVNDTISQITVDAGEDSTDNNFGEVTPPPEPASISGFVYCDENDDGVKDAGETGLGGVTVQLLNAAGAVVSTTTTDTDGSYSFTGLDAGTYSVVEPNQPAGKDDGQETAGSTGGNTDVNDTISQITVNAGEDSVNNNFGEVTPPPEPASISGFVYCDENDDGVKDAGEAGLGGVTVQLLNAAGAVVSTTTTDTDGSYSFTGLDAGTYSVVEPNQPAGKDDGQETAGSTGGNTDVNDTISQITVNAGEDSVNNNFGEVTPPPEPASISGFVYCDENDDGVKDAGEAGLGGATVQLLNAAGAVVSTTTTDTDGSYSFTGLDAGTYSVVEPNQPAGKDDGQETAGSTGGNTDVNDTISQITVNAGEDSVNNNFGEVTPPPEPASISGFVYCDENDDGVKDAGEAGLGGVTVQLLNAAGAVVSTTTTDTDGSYSFTGLDAGTYSVVEPNQPAGKNDGQETAGSTGGNTTVNDTISEITVNAGEDSTDNNFGEVTPPPEPASISGFVYCDENDDGVKDAGEAGLGGVTVQLLNAAGAVVSTTTTDADGAYSFTGLDAGTYSVVEPNQPAGKNDGQETAGSTGGNTTVNDTISEITVNAGEDSTDNNFGEVTPPPEPASISGFVYCDENDDGVKDAGEAGLGGVTVQLLNAAGAVVSTTTTDADGAYSFTGLDAGTYSVVEPNQPAGKNDGQETAGSTGGNTTVNDTISEITVNAGEDSTDNNFGEVTPPPEPASISGFVYCDENDDGVKDAGEAGLGGVTVQLLNAAGAVVSTTTTDADGAYSFTGLDAGTYSVVEPNQPAGKNDGQETAGSTGGNTTVNDTISEITVNAGEDSTDNNFGEVTPPPEPASISGFVYCDENDDGVKDAGEAGLGGVTVQLLNAAGAVVSTTTTDADGAYSFTGLDAGTYSVVEPNQPAGKNDGQETAGSTGGNTTVNDTISEITVNAGEDSTGNNFGEVTPPASLGDYVWFDENGNGRQDDGNTGMNGVTVNLIDGAGNQVATTTTANDTNGIPGYYLFSNLIPGDYQVEFVSPDGFQFTTQDQGDDAGDSDADTTTGLTVTTTLEAGENDLSWDAGLIKCTAKLGDRVWLDANDNGMQDAGEAGVADVTVTLLDAGADGVLNTADDLTTETVTDANGNYLFTEVENGKYQILFDVPDNLEVTVANVGDDTKDSDVTATSVTQSKLEAVNLIAVSSTAGFVNGGGGYIEDSLDDSFAYNPENPTGPMPTIHWGSSGGKTGFHSDIANGQDAHAVYGLESTYTVQGANDSFVIDFYGRDRNKNRDDDFDVEVFDASGNSIGVVQGLAIPNIGNPHLRVDIAAELDLVDGQTIGSFEVIGHDTADSGGNYFTLMEVRAAAEHSNLIVNGDFEENGAGQFTSIPGWTGMGDSIEINPDNVYGVHGATGTKVVEIDANSVGDATGMYQDIETIEGQQYELSLDVAKRAGTLSASNTVVVEWDGKIIGVIEPNSTTFETHTFTVNGNGTDRLKLREQDGDDNGVGGIIDNVRLVASDHVSSSQVAETGMILVDGWEDNLTIDAGLVSKSASISGFVYCDENDDGVKDAGEAGLGGVTVQLLNAAGAVVSTTTTDADGAYSFTGLDAGTYSVVEPNQPAGKNDGQETAGSTGGNTTVNDTISEITVNAGEDSTGNNFGEVTPPASLGDYVWFDENGNGRQDDGNTGMNGVTVNLIDGAGNQVATTTTANDTNGIPGYYLFSNLIPGDYQVEFVSPDGFQFTTQDQGDDAGDSDADTTTGLTVTTTLEAGENDLSWDAGLIKCTAKLGDRVWLDANDNGMQDAGEAGVADVTVTLLDAGADGVLNTADDLTTETVTDANGNYLFTEVENGKYQILFDVPDNLEVTVANVGDDTKDSDVTATSVTQSKLEAVNLIAVSSTAGFVNGGGGYIEDSLDDSFAYNPENPTGPMPTIHWGSSGGKTGFHSDIANGQDAHAVYGLESTYTVQGANDSFVIDFYGRDRNKNRDDDFDVEVFDASGNSIGVVQGLAIPNIGNPHLRVDIAAELDLVDGQTIGSFEVIGHDTADSGGNYFTLMEVRAAAEHSNLIVNGDFEENGAGQFTSIPGWTGMGDSIEINPDNVYGVHGATGTKVVEIDANSVGDATGMYQDIETIEGQQYELSLDVAKRAGTLSATNTVVVEWDGEIIGVIEPNSTTFETHTFTVNGNGANRLKLREQDGDDNGVGGIIDNVRLVASDHVSSQVAETGMIVVDGWEDNLTIDAGLVEKKAAIGNRVWEDKNFNGIQDAGEPGVGGVKVSLYAKNSNGTNYVKEQTTTDSNGHYSFDNLNEGDYHIRVIKDTLPGGAKLTHRDRGDNDAKDSDAFYSYTEILTNWTHLSQGENDPTWDIGIYRKASFGDRVWIDDNHNDIQDITDQGRAGIKVTLKGSTEEGGEFTVGTTTTNSNGNYLFDNLDPGYYYATFDKAVTPDSWHWAVQDYGSNDNIDSDVRETSDDITSTPWTFLESGENDMSWDAGITPIVIDLNGDGIQTVSRDNAQGSFDLFGNGTEVESGWISSDDGFLAIDSNGNGTIDDISELFGGVNQGDGFAKLASFDSNGDGVVNADDADFGSLSIWQDTDGDHQTDAGELVSLTDAGVESLTVDFTELPFVDNQGNLHLERSTATLTNGTAVDMTDVYFNVALADAQAAGVDLPSLAELSGYDQVIPEEVVDVPSAFVADPVWTV